jgi:hypothetical protein
MSESKPGFQYAAFSVAVAAMIVSLVWMAVRFSGAGTSGSGTIDGNDVAVLIGQLLLLLGSLGLLFLSAVWLMRAEAKKASDCKSVARIEAETKRTEAEIKLTETRKQGAEKRETLEALYRLERTIWERLEKAAAVTEIIENTEDKNGEPQTKIIVSKLQLPEKQVAALLTSLKKTYKDLLKKINDEKTDASNTETPKT